MSDSPLKLAVIVGSVREGRFGPVPARWFVQQAEKHGQFDVELIDLADHPLPHDLPMSLGQEASAEVVAAQQPLRDRLAAADAFVVVTPEYNHGYPATLKNTIDWFGEEWAAKPVGLVSYGGVGGGLRAAEQLRGVFAEVQAMTIRELISFHKFWELFDNEGQVSDPEALEAAKGFLDQLLWWGNALRDARAKTPYQV